MDKNYLVYGYHQYEDYHLEVTVDTTKAKNQKEAITSVELNDFGTVFFDLDTVSLYVDYQNTVTVLGELNVRVCEILEPRADVAHELLMGVPIYEQEDLQPVSLSKVIQYCVQEYIRKDKATMVFDCIAFGVEEIRNGQL